VHDNTSVIDPRPASRFSAASGAGTDPSAGGPEGMFSGIAAGVKWGSKSGSASHSPPSRPPARTRLRTPAPALAATPHA